MSKLLLDLCLLSYPDLEHGDPSPSLEIVENTIHPQGEGTWSLIPEKARAMVSCPLLTRVPQVETRPFLHVDIDGWTS